MTQELLYTSAPKGLKPGSRGFCTVVSTHGMPAPLVTALESLSAYRQVFPHGHARSSDNPVNWSHVLMSAGGRPVHVLSRISDYGLDYTQRSNKLAHHLVLAESECPPAGPAWVLQQNGVAQGEWDGTVRTLPQGRAIPSGRATSLRAGAWEQVTGDAGWAGVVADALVADPYRQIFLIFSAGQDLLPLVAEVIALLPESLRWGITFSTYATQLPPNATCQWRCHLADSPEAQQSLRFVKALRIDLTKSLGMAPGGPLVETARTGRSAPAPTIHMATPPSPASPPDIEFTEAVAALPPARHESTAQPPTSTYRLARSPDAPSIRPAPPPMRRPARSRSMPIGLIGFIFAVSLVILATIGSVFVVGRRPQQVLPSGQVVASKADTPEPPPQPKSPDENSAAGTEPTPNDAGSPPYPVQEKELDSSKKSVIADSSMAPAETETASASATPKTQASETVTPPAPPATSDPPMPDPPDGPVIAYYGGNILDDASKSDGIVSRLIKLSAGKTAQIHTPKLANAQDWALGIEGNAQGRKYDLVVRVVGQNAPKGAKIASLESTKDKTDDGDQAILQIITPLKRYRQFLPWCAVSNASGTGFTVLQQRSVIHGAQLERGEWETPLSFQFSDKDPFPELLVSICDLKVNDTRIACTPIAVDDEKKRRGIVYEGRLEMTESALVSFGLSEKRANGSKSSFWNPVPKDSWPVVRCELTKTGLKLSILANGTGFVDALREGLQLKYSAFLESATLKARECQVPPAIESMIPKFQVGMVNCLVSYKSMKMSIDKLLSDPVVSANKDARASLETLKQCVDGFEPDVTDVASRVSGLKELGNGFPKASVAALAVSFTLLGRDGEEDESINVPLLEVVASDKDIENDRQ